MADLRSFPDDPFLQKFEPLELRTASEFLSVWLPFLSRDLCHTCVQTLSRRVRSLDPSSEPDEVEDAISGSTPSTKKSHKLNDDKCDSCSIGSWDEGENPSTSDLVRDSPVIQTPAQVPTQRKSWADMAQEDEFEEEGELNVNKHSLSENSSTGKVRVSNVRSKPELSRDQREYMRFMNVKRNKDFICFERVKGKLVNILEGLELHKGIFSAVEQKRIVDYVYELQDMGRNGKLKERTFTAPQKWMRGKGRETIQFGCCYNYATDKNGNPPGILQKTFVDPIPHLFKVIIRRLVKWRVLPPTCVPDSCIVNIYEEGDCIPPHIDNHDFVRPFCTVSFLSECDILFGSDLKIVGPGEFSGSIAISLPVGSVLVLNGNGADVAKHCVPAVPTKRISITFRRMDESKRPFGYIPEADLQGLQPLSYKVDKSRSASPIKPHPPTHRQVGSREGNAPERGETHSEPRYSSRPRQVNVDGRNVRVSFGS